jgi:hypothetical protein
MSTADDIKRLIRTPHVNSQVDTLADALQSERDALLEALRNLCRNFPTDSDMEAAGWGQLDIDRACLAYDEARALFRASEGKAA